METKKKALGKGLEQLFSNNVIDFDNFEKEIVEDNKNNITEVNLSEIRSNPYQPRKTFNDDSLQELATSIKQYGIVEPVIVKKSVKGYELIAGERRCKAAKLAGLKTVPAVIKEFNDQEMMEIALIENIQREDLNPIDEANSILNIINMRGWTQEEFATFFGKSRSYVTNILGLLNLPDDIKKMVIDKSLSMSHARILSKIENEEQVRLLANKIVRDKINVRELEKIVSSDDSLEKRKPIVNKKVDSNLKIYEEAFSDITGNKVNINNKKIEIYYDSIKDLERIMEIFNISLGDE